MNFFLMSSVLLLFFSGSRAFSSGNKSNYSIYDWKILKTIHFNIYYPYGMEEIAKYSAQIAEEAYVISGNYLKYELPKTASIVVHPSFDDFQKRHIKLGIIDEGCAGFDELINGQINVVFDGDFAEFRHVITHEIVHVFQYDMMSFDNYSNIFRYYNVHKVPLWVLEGMSEFISLGYDESADLVMRDLVRNGMYPDIKDMHGADSKYLLYKQGQSFFYFFEETYGKDSVGELLRNIHNYSDLDKAFFATTKRNLDEIGLEWIEFLKNKYSNISNHQNNDESAFHVLSEPKIPLSSNIFPSISPAGEKVTYFSNDNFHTSVFIMNKDNGSNKKLITIGGWKDNEISLLIYSNTISWVNKGKWIIFSANDYNKSMIYIVDSSTGYKIQSIELPFLSILDPSLSADLKRIVFVGQNNVSLDVYIYDIENRALRRITNDFFVERYPEISSDSSFVIFSSNRNDKKSFDSKDFKIVKFDLLKNEEKILVAGKGLNLQGDLSFDGNNLLYVSNKDGAFNIYKYDLISEKITQITNEPTGAFLPRYSQDKINYVVYDMVGFKILSKNVGNSETQKKDAPGIQYERREFPDSYLNLNDVSVQNYNGKIVNDSFLFLGGTLHEGYSGLIHSGFSDDIGSHYFGISAEYLNYTDQHSKINFDLNYHYSKDQLVVGLGIFRQGLPLGNYLIENDIMRYQYSDSKNILKEGGYVDASYGFAAFFSNDFKFSAYKFDQSFVSNSKIKNVSSDFLELKDSIIFDDTITTIMGPIYGNRSEVYASRTQGILSDNSHWELGFDLREYLLMKNTFGLAFKFLGGHIFSNSNSPFRYSVGGFDTLRGHPLGEYSGQNMLLLNSEFNIMLIRNFGLGFFPMRIGGFSVAFFADTGSVWDNKYNFRDPRTGNFDDFKAGLGYGFRFAVMPSIYFRLDFAWPYYLKNFGDMKIMYGMGMEF